jgi:hypothetical protein
MASRLYPQMASVADYVACSARLRDAVGPDVVNLLTAGVSVVLDFPANTLINRAWMKGLFEAAGADHQLHYLDVADEVCRRGCGPETPKAITPSRRPMSNSI